MADRNYVLLTVLIFLIGFLIVLRKRKLVNKNRLRRLITAMTLAVIVFTTLAVVLFPDLSSVAATGIYPYASQIVELTDPSRIEDYADDGRSRSLSVLVYYPDTENIEKKTCPLIVFSHGGISTKTSNLSLFKELASHGYVVASIDHPYHALRTKIGGEYVSIDSGYMKELNAEDSHSDIGNSYERFREWMALRMGDIDFVISSFIEESKNEDSSFYSLIDADRIGAAGHSLGGSAALGSARQRDDIRAVLALESPYMSDITGVNGDRFIWNTDPYPCAIMNIYSDTGFPLIETDNKYVQNQNMYTNGQAENCYIEGSNHFSLTDLVRTSPILCALLGGGYSRSGYSTLEEINQRSLAFFNSHLKSMDAASG